VNSSITYNNDADSIDRVLTGYSLYGRIFV
jgi:hypothetical protein